jgi:hypothetical protein
MEVREVWNKPLERERTPTGEGRQRQQIAPLQVWLDYLVTILSLPKRFLGGIYWYPCPPQWESNTFEHMGLEVYLKGDVYLWISLLHQKKKEKRNGSYVYSLRMRRILHLLKEVVQFALCIFFGPFSRVTSSRCIQNCKVMLTSVQNRKVLLIGQRDLMYRVKFLF